MLVKKFHNLNEANIESVELLRQTVADRQVPKSKVNSFRPQT